MQRPVEGLVVVVLPASSLDRHHATVADTANVVAVLVHANIADGRVVSPQLLAGVQLEIAVRAEQQDGPRGRADGDGAR